MKKLLGLVKRNKQYAVIACLVFAGRSHAQEDAVANLDFAKGQVVSFITSKPLPGTDEKKNVYFSKVFPSAQEKGFTQRGSFVIQSVNQHGFKTESHVGRGNLMSIFLWPDEQSIEKFRTETPDWPELKKMREEIWEELRIVRMTFQKNVDLEFKQNKTYRLVLVWQNEENPKDLDKYQKAMKKTRESLGAKYLIQWDKVDYYHSFTAPSEVPDLAWIIEWPSSASHREYLESQAFKDNVQSFMSGVSKFEAYEVNFRF